LLVVREISTNDRESVIEISGKLSQWFIKAALEAIAHAVETERGYLALENEKCMGFATYLPCSDRKRAELTWIGVEPTLHRTGIGRSLVEAIERDLVRDHYECLEVNTVAETVDYEPYARTRSFYHSIGFRDVSVQPKGFPSGDDKLLMRKYLRNNTNSFS